MPDKKLLFSVTLADCEMQTFTAGGPGGQHQNHSNTAVRIKHRASGATGEARDSKSQTQNKKAAFRKMAESKKFQGWVALMSASAGKDPLAEVEKDMAPHKLLIEGRGDDGWEIIG